jgi:hypothetical protein
VVLHVSNHEPARVSALEAKWRYGSAADRAGGVRSPINPNFTTQQTGLTQESADQVQADRRPRSGRVGFSAKTKMDAVGNVQSLFGQTRALRRGSGSRFNSVGGNYAARPLSSRRRTLLRPDSKVGFGPMSRHAIARFNPASRLFLPPRKACPTSAKPMFAAPAPTGRAEGTSRDNRASARYQRECQRARAALSLVANGKRSRR